MSTETAKQVRVSAARVLGEKFCRDCRRYRKIVAFDPGSRLCKDCRRALEIRIAKKS
jgi:hypothetical protein